jgi:rubrerythrin
MTTHTRSISVLDTLEPALLQDTMARQADGGTVSTPLVLAAAASVPLALGVFAQRAYGQAGALPQGIRDVLNFALTLEYLEADFYRRGLAAGGLIPAADRAIFAQIGRHEDEHVTLLRSVLGSAAVNEPVFDFTAGGAFADVFSNYPTFLALAQGFEDTGVRAYKGQAAELISNNELLTVALQIHSVEARHASKVRRMRGQKGWVVGDTTDVAALAAVYAGDGLTTQAGVDTSSFASAGAASEAFDEPLGRADVLAIAGLFLA